ncbi:hypothetical protein EN962_26175 [Mesorhizobium sp. M7A.F.Ca.CA.001.09.2.1]|uniref:Uncharacterized protein n=1 Tax=Mesorhizobium ciceri TaxID=39645 RepID=A0AB38T5Z6_9HYPH|nr:MULTISPECIES: hypothetical protein [Mesorhizobium]RUY22433.1 hypothetical protein EN981_35020 [Mesorhizobium sp. M7A.F.Ca.CA.001.13.2.1]MDF3217498.1 hypothetical protein [Mesorhizobium ciceri]RUY66309.1 hypothetical protein EN980_20375 [Mesorhizobium sp. M7A.F.Ca.CA.001.13.1.1]RUY69700.1 hypothetical protein EN965_11230 [Mesorhizobium sp. M7A.F.Ca.CA.001.05.1.1]RUY74605.1 hypothetical protein EN962_26175 [Mesorhizobium sp. M7A.F.Ca.CA.001.09.2.1]
MATMLENHIAWMKKEVVSLNARIEMIEAGKARFYSKHDNGPSVDTTDTILADNKELKAELEGLLKEYDN